MKPVRTSLSRTLLTLLCGVVVTASMYGPMTAPRAEAQFGGAVFDVANFITNTAQTTILQTLNGVAWAVAKTAIQSMTKSMVNWINSGYQGEPAFSQNLNRDLRQVADAVPSHFLSNLNKNITAGKLASPFAAQVADITVKAYLLSTSADYLTERLRYTLLDHTQDSVAYMRGNFSQGGLDAWHALTYNCANDFTCSSEIVREDLVRQIDDETRKFLADYNNGRGFLSWKGECTQYKQSAAQNDEAYNSVCSGANYNAEDCAALLNSDENAGLNNESVALSDADECIANDIQTPGSLVEQTLGITVNSPLRQLELADSVNEIVGAVVTQMVGQVLGGTGLAGLSAPSSNGGNRPIDVATNPGTTGSGGSSGAGFSSVVETEIVRATETKTAWEEILPVAQEAKDACVRLSGLVGIAQKAEIDKAITRSNTMIARAGTALVSLGQISTALSDGTENQTNQQAWDVYQHLLSSNGLISTQEWVEANSARSELTPDSVYSHMKKYAQGCR